MTSGVPAPPLNPRKRQPRAIAATNKRRGAQVERVVADYLAAATGLAVERRRLEGVLDRGDLAGIPGVVVEIKSGNPCLTAWLKETERERRNAGAEVGVLWWAPPGLAKNPARHVVLIRPEHAFRLSRSGGPMCVPLRVPATQIEWHTSQHHRYHLSPWDVCVMSGFTATRSLNWAVFA